MTGSVKAIGVDPGLAATGFAVVEMLETHGKACQWGTITTSTRLSFSERLGVIYARLADVLASWQPRLLVIEDVYVDPKFPRAAIQLGAVRGVVFLAAQHSGIAVVELKPTEVKSALTGDGRASKQHVGRVTRKILSLRGAVPSDHVTDAMALAITGLSRNGCFRW